MENDIETTPSRTYSKISTGQIPRNRNHIKSDSQTSFRPRRNSILSVTSLTPLALMQEAGNMTFHQKHGYFDQRTIPSQNLQSLPEY